MDAADTETRSTVRVLPSAVTVLALCAGLSAIKFALDGTPAASLAMIGAAAVLDALDGRIARMLDATSRIGAELDSLADAVSFGVAPALVLYVTLLEGSRLGWVVSLLYAVCLVLRLARFNTLLGGEDEQPSWTKEFFVGVPAPAAAVIVLAPVTASLELGEGWWSSTVVVEVWVVLAAGLAISRVPTLSLKSARVPPRLAAALLVGVGALAAGLITFPLLVLLGLVLAYLAHIPYAAHRSRWLAAHPVAWDSSPRERRAIRKSLPRRRPRLRRRSRAVAGRSRPAR
ncbi:CDP-diacylglycerol--serine O-phosphatidyltransferase [Rhodococcus aerolatus]